MDYRSAAFGEKALDLLESLAGNWCEKTQAEGLRHG